MDLDGLTGRVFAAVLFDLDGTLVDSTPAVARSWRRLGVELGAELGPVPHGMPSAQVMRALFPERWREAALRMERIEVADTGDIAVLPGTLAALAALREVRAAIVTSCTRPLADVRIAAAGLQPPAVVVTADQTPVGKPDPAPFLLAARRLGVRAGDCLVVEDAPAGLASARAAGAATLAVTTTHAAGELDADAIVPDLAAVRFLAVGGGGVRVESAGGKDHGPEPG